MNHSARFRLGRRIMLAMWMAMGFASAMEGLIVRTFVAGLMAFAVLQVKGRCPCEQCRAHDEEFNK